jgi:hypothetical protein
MLCFRELCAQSGALGFTEVKTLGGLSTRSGPYDVRKTIELKVDWRGASGSFEVMQVIKLDQFKATR